jgi:hypothetical protein
MTTETTKTHDEAQRRHLKPYSLSNRRRIKWPKRLTPPWSQQPPASPWRSGAGVPERVVSAGVPAGRLWLSLGSSTDRAHPKFRL